MCKEGRKEDVEGGYRKMSCVDVTIMMLRKKKKKKKKKRRRRRGEMRR